MCPAASTRWCPTPEQVMILEEMYRGGVRTPNATHIQQITSHLSHYGKIEGKNVFYWFQNHKARDRQKLRKRLLGKQLQLQHQHHHQLHPHHIDQMMMFHQIPYINSDHHHHHHTPLLHHFEQLPCFPSSSSTNPGFIHHPLQFLNSTPPACFGAHHQTRSDDPFARMGNICSWKGDDMDGKFGLGKEKTPMSTITNEDDYEYDYNYQHEYEEEDEEDTSRRPIKTLELFPIKDKTSLKKDVAICGQPSRLPFVN